MYRPVRRSVAASALFSLLVAGSVSSGLAQDPTADIDAATLVPDGIVGPSQAGDLASDPALAWLTDEECAAAKEQGFRIGIVMQTMNIEWSTEQVRGVTDGLARCGGEVIAVTNPDFMVEKQIGQIDDMILLKPDAIISIPVDDVATAASYRKIQQAGIKLVMMDNVPAGLKHKEDYQTVVSSDSQGLGAVSALTAEAYKTIAEAGIKLILMHQVPQGLTYPDDYQAVISPDNQGNGQVAAQMLAAHIPQDGVVGIVDFGVDFFTTNERTRRVKSWFAENRADVTIKQVDFVDTTRAGDAASSFLTANPDIDGMWVVWDAPAMQVAAELRAQGKDIPITTIDLGIQAGVELAKCGLVKGIAAQQPYDQGVAEAEAALQVLLGNQPPPWIVLPAVPVLPSNLTESYRVVFHEDPPPELLDACKAENGCM